jgi:hypothetical protein
MPTGVPEGLAAEGVASDAAFAFDEPPPHADVTSAAEATRLPMNASFRFITIASPPFSASTLQPTLLLI